MTKVSPTPESVFRKHGGVLRMSDALAAGLNRKSLYALRNAGTITRLSRGVYRLASLPELEAPDLAIGFVVERYEQRRCGLRIDGKVHALGGDGGAQLVRAPGTGRKTRFHRPHPLT